MPTMQDRVKSWPRGDRLGIGSLVVALILWIPASFASACDPCGSYDGVQAVARAAVAFAPIWLLGVAALATRFRPALFLLLIAAVAMAILTAMVGTDVRTAFASAGLESARGFVVYAVPFAITAVAAALGLRG